VAPFQGSTLLGATYLLGTIGQNLATNLPGGLGVTDWYWPTTTIWDDDVPFIRWLLAKNDETNDWPLRVDAIERMDDLRFGSQIFWDQRMHISYWLFQHWTFSELLNPRSLTKHRNDQSFPGFGPGEVPGECFTDPDEDWGTWGGFIDWDVDTIIDASDEWGATVFLVSKSPKPNDIPEFESCRADLSIQRAQAFFPEPGTPLYWTNEVEGTGSILQEGRLVSWDKKAITIPGVTVQKTPTRVRIFVATVDDDAADDGADDDVIEDDDSEDSSPEETPDGDDDADKKACGC
jgi:hypothetical protein